VTHAGSRRGRTKRFALVVLALGIGIPAPGSAHGTTNGYQDNFESYGNNPLPGFLASDPWEIKSGAWRVAEQPLNDAPTATDVNRILIQDSKAITPNEPLAFVRAKSFRQLTIQVTAAMLDPINAFGDTVASSSVGVVFRAPITDGISDKDNLYLFTSVVTGVAPGFPTGKAYALFKRVGRGYYLLNTKIASTWADFSKPHDYKVVMAQGHVTAYIDGRLVIDHTDIPSGDTPTLQDPFPGLPFDQGAVGLRTSGTRAWFDNFSVVGNDAYEARANALDFYTNYGASGQGPQTQARRGVALQASAEMNRMGTRVADTGFLYHDHDFDEAFLRPLVDPSTGRPAGGATIGASAKNGVVTSTLRLSGVTLKVADPDGRLQVILVADAIDATATASCGGTDSFLNVVNGSIYVQVKGVDRVGDTVFGPFPFNHAIRPNTVIYEKPQVISIVAHARISSTAPRRVEMAALKVVVPESGGITVPAQQTPPTPAGGGTRTPETTVGTAPLELTLGPAVAGRYCQ
jgi:hypothetical protein